MEFSTLEAQSILGISPGKINLALSRLTQSGWLTRSGRGTYMVTEPSVIFSAVQDGWFERLKGRGVLPCLQVAIGEIFRVYGDRLNSVAVFGSVARGDESKTSDIDILLVADTLSDNYTDRISELRGVHKACSDVKIKQWVRTGEYHPLDIVVVSPRELGANRLFLLDLTQDALIIHDRDDLLKKTLQSLRDRMAEKGSRRIETASGKRYWELEPKARVGEIIEV